MSDTKVAVWLTGLAATMALLGFYSTFFSPETTEQKLAYLVAFAVLCGISIYLAWLQASHAEAAKTESDALLRKLSGDMASLAESTGPGLYVETGYLMSGPRGAQTDLLLVNRSPTHALLLTFRGLEEGNEHQLRPVPEGWDEGSRDAIIEMINVQPLSLPPNSHQRHRLILRRWFQDERTNTAQHLTLEIEDLASGGQFRFSIPGSARWP